MTGVQTCALPICHIRRISDDYAGRIEIYWGDALGFVRNNREHMQNTRCFVYIDPPYYEQGHRLYRHFYNDNDHEELAALITQCTFPWLVSYDDHPFINQLYFGQQIQDLYRDYTAGSQPKRAKELLISNLIIPPTRTIRYSVAVADD